jgi:protein CpxP
MKRDTFFILAIVVLFVLNLFTLGYVMFGHRDKPQFPFGPQGPQGRIEERLKLAPEQQKQFEELKKEHRGPMEILQKNSKDLHDKYFDLLKSDNPNIPARDSLLQVMAKNQSEMDKVTFDHFKKLKDICTPEQKKLYDVFIDEISRSTMPRPESDRPSPPRDDRLPPEDRK